MSAIGFVIRGGSGSMRNGEITRQGVTKMQVEKYSDISLHAEKSQMRGFTRDGADLVIELGDGTTVILQNFFLTDGTPVSQLYLSAGGEIREVTFSGADGNILFTQYSESQPWQKWSDVDGLVFFDRPEPMVFAEGAGGNEASMLATLVPGLLGGAGVSGVAAAGAAVAGAVVVGNALSSEGSGETGAGASGGGSSSGSGGTEGGGSGNGGSGGPQSLFTAQKISGGADGVVNKNEAAGTVEFYGTAEPGAKVDVLWAGVTQSTTADSEGKWSVAFTPSLVPENAEGVQSAQVTATNQDGSTDQAILDVQYDTIVRDFGINDGIETDNVVNAAERSDGVEISGKAEPNSQIAVELNGYTYNTTSNSSGEWTVNVQNSNLPTGTQDLIMKVTATDTVGNVEVLNKSIKVDTEVESFTSSETNGGNIVSTMNAQSAVVLSGTVEPGSQVFVTIGGETVEATVTGSTWSVNVPESVLQNLQGQEGTLPYTVNATDPAGNTSEITDSVGYDFDVPEVSKFVSYERTVDSEGSNGTGYIRLDADSANLDAKLIDNSGAIGQIGEKVTADGDNFKIEFPDGPLADGSKLLVTATDDNGNSSSSLIVTGSDDSVELDLSDSGLAGENLELVDLSFVKGGELTITEEQLEALSKTDSDLRVRGGSDDLVKLKDAVLEGTETIEGQTYNVYSLGDAGRVLVEDEITNVTVI